MKYVSTPSSVLGLGPTQTLRRALVSRLKLHHLRVVIEVDRQLSVSKAAQVLHLAQPAVTKTLREVEEIFGTELFERQPRGMVLNECGSLVLPHIHAVFADLDRIGDELSTFRSGLAGVVTVGATMSALPYLLPYCLADMAAKNTEIIVRVIEGTIDQMLKALDRGEVDLVLGRVLTAHTQDSLVREIFFDDPFVTVVGAHHKLARTGEAEVADLSHFPWILPLEGSSSSEPLQRHMIHSGVQSVRHVIETVSHQMILGLLAETNMVAILPQHLAQAGAKRGLLAIVGPKLVEGSLPIGVSYRRDRPLSPAAKAVKDVFSDVVQSMKHHSESSRSL